MAEGANGPGGAVATAAAIGGLIQVFAPEVLLIMGIIRAHMEANKGQFPSPEQVQATYEAVTGAIAGVWASWTPSGDGT